MAGVVYKICMSLFHLIKRSLTALKTSKYLPSAPVNSSTFAFSILHTVCYRDARQQLQDKGLVVIDGNMVWINREVEANREPYSDSED